jgi:hypothetical protein
LNKSLKEPFEFELMLRLCTDAPVTGTEIGLINILIPPRSAKLFS